MNATHVSIHPKKALGAVHLIVSDLARSLDFDQRVLGFKTIESAGGSVWLGIDGGQKSMPLLVLNELPGSTPARSAAGLYHFAILLPDRYRLAQALLHLGETRAVLEGFADHLVSDAIYLADPDWIGIEIYRDRRREDWERDAAGGLRMATDPLNLDSLLGELEGRNEKWPGLREGTTIGHIHLRVADLAQAEAFYQGVLGFDLVMRYGPSASFLSAGGYHHHIGLNTWGGRGVLPPPPGTTGLRWFEIHLPGQAALGEILARAERAGLPVQEERDGVLLRDPSQNGVWLGVAESDPWPG